jgi:hypothetical protein
VPFLKIRLGDAYEVPGWVASARSAQPDNNDDDGGEEFAGNDDGDDNDTCGGGSSSPLHGRGEAGRAVLRGAIKPSSNAGGRGRRGRDLGLVQRRRF